MGSSLSNEKINNLRRQINEEIENLYYNNRNCSTEQELGQIINRRNLSNNLLHYIDNYNEIENYFQIIKIYGFKNSIYSN